MIPDIDRDLMRKKDRLSICLAWVGIATGIITIVTVVMGIFIAIYIHPVENKIITHIAKDEPENEALKMKVNTLETQYVEIIKKLDQIEFVLRKNNAR